MWNCGHDERPASGGGEPFAGGNQGAPDALGTEAIAANYFAVDPVFGVVPDCVPVDPVAPGAPPLWFMSPVSFSCIVLPGAGCSPWAFVFPFAGVCGCMFLAAGSWFWVPWAIAEVAKMTAPATRNALSMPSSYVGFSVPGQRVEWRDVPHRPPDFQMSSLQAFWGRRGGALGARSRPHLLDPDHDEAQAGQWNAPLFLAALAAMELKHQFRENLARHFLSEGRLRLGSLLPDSPTNNKLGSRKFSALGDKIMRWTILAGVVAIFLILDQLKYSGYYGREVTSAIENGTRRIGAMLR
jgi:hypothetical protein